MASATHPRLLKDFLIDDSLPNRQFSFRSVTLNRIDARKLQRSGSKAAQSTILAFNAVIKVVKNFRALSRKKNSINEIDRVTVKDIIRWKSFGGLSEKIPLRLDCSPNRCTTVTTTTASTSTTTCSSNGSSWCESDFSSVFLPEWNGNFEECGEIEDGKKYLPRVGGDYMETRSSKDEVQEQHSPISVLELEYRHVEENESYREKEEEYKVKKRAIKMVNKVKETSLEKFDLYMDNILLDFFVDELAIKRCEIRDIEIENEIVDRAKTWISGEKRGIFECGRDDKREACLREIEEGDRWKSFKEEEQEWGLEIETQVFDSLVDELLVDVISIR